MSVPGLGPRYVPVLSRVLFQMTVLSTFNESLLPSKMGT